MAYCPNAPVKKRLFGLIKSQDHELEIVLVSRCFRDTHEVIYKCKYECGLSKEGFISTQELLNRGWPIPTTYKAHGIGRMYDPRDLPHEQEKDDG